MKFLIILCFSIFLLEVNYSQINTERYRLDSDSIGFTGIMDIELTAITGNTNLQFINLGGRINYNWGPSYTFLVTDGGFGWDDGERIFDQALLHLRHVQSLSELIQLEIFTQSDFNKKRLLTQRHLAGTGLRFRIFKQDNLKIRAGTSFFYEYERYDLPEQSVHGNKLSVVRLSAYFTFDYEIKNDVKLICINYFQPQLDRWADFRILSDNSLIISLSEIVDLKTSFNLRYDSKQPESIKGTDTFTKFGFTFNF